MKISCGTLILNEFGELLACHSTGNSFFDLPKGLLEEGESALDCAVRECMEETSFELNPSRLVDLGEFPYTKEKRLRLFLYRTYKSEVDLDKLKCESFFESPKTGRMIPEADGFAWKPISEASSFAAKSMAKLLSEIVASGKLESVAKKAKNV